MTDSQVETYQTSKRKEYLDGKITHSEYYLLLAEALGRSSVASMVLQVAGSVGKIRAALKTDQHLNNIPLLLWDAHHPGMLRLVRNCPYRVRVPIVGSTGWSLSDTVCVLKETARAMAEDPTIPD